MHANAGTLAEHLQKVTIPARGSASRNWGLCNAARALSVSLLCICQQNVGLIKTFLFVLKSCRAPCGTTSARDSGMAPGQPL